MAEQTRAMKAAPRPGRRWRLMGGFVGVLALFAMFVAWASRSGDSRHVAFAELAANRTPATWRAASSAGVFRGTLDHVELPQGATIDLAFDAVSSRYLGADATGGLRRASASADDAPYRGLLSAFAALDDGRLVFCGARSGYSVDYSLYVVSPTRSAAGAGQGGSEVRSMVKEDRIAAPGFATLLVATDGRDIFYATKNARLGKVSPEGKEYWKVILARDPTALSAGRDGRIVTGDDRGNVAVISADGAAQWSTHVSPLPINAVGFCADGVVVAVDGKGVIHRLNAQGRAISSTPIPAGIGRVRAVVAREDAMDVVTDAGHILRIEAPSRVPMLSASEFEEAKWLGGVGFAVALATLGVACSRRASRRLRDTLQRGWQGRAGYVLLLPAFGLLVVFCYYPMGTALAYSFARFSLTSAVEFAGLENFRTMFSDPYLGQSVVNMVILLLTGLVKMIVLPLLAAELVFWLPGERWQQFFRSAMIFPAVVPGVVMVLVWKMIYDPYNGLINVTLRALHLEGATRAWLGDEHFALASVVFYNFPWINLLIFLIFLGGLIQIDRSVFEAVEMDGASMWQRFWHVDLPALRPKINLAVTLIFIWSVQDFASVLILTGGGPGMATYVPALQMFRQISDGHNLGYTSAIGFALFLLVMAFTLFNRRFNGEEET